MTTAKLQPKTASNKTELANHVVGIHRLTSVNLTLVSRNVGRLEHSRRHKLLFSVIKNITFNLVSGSVY